jgi:hypothetical protein
MTRLFLPGAEDPNLYSTRTTHSLCAFKRVRNPSDLAAPGRVRSAPEADEGRMKQMKGSRREARSFLQSVFFITALPMSRTPYLDGNWLARALAGKPVPSGTLLRLDRARSGQLEAFIPVQHSVSL